MDSFVNCSFQIIAMFLQLAIVIIDVWLLDGPSIIRSVLFLASFSNIIRDDWFVDLDFRETLELFVSQLVGNTHRIVDPFFRTNQVIYFVFADGSRV